MTNVSVGHYRYHDEQIQDRFCRPKIRTHPRSVNAPFNELNRRDNKANNNKHNSESHGSS
ncbi:hypothetical protein YC2023_078353 [Brassica napus]